MISITQPLPKEINIDGELYPISWTFKTGIKFEELINDKSLSDEQRLLKILMLYYPDKIPCNISEAIEGLLWFFKGGQEDKPTRKTRSKKSSKAQYSFTQDSGLIYAAFVQAYGIDLFKVTKLHWWAFKELFACLPEDCMFSKVLTYRSISLTSNMSKEQKEFYKEMKEKYRLEKSEFDIERLEAVEEILLSGDMSKLKGGVTN
ncbi:bacteriophage Gp15 family protein [Eubacteriaceae bacterium ES2]|nr:bacteriophage Gp15 family protein [Eubacteriaceae bacterium ES2]